MRIYINTLHLHCDQKQFAEINLKLDTIMTTQAETAVVITALTAQVTKIQSETDSLIAKITTLTQNVADAVAQAGTTDPAVTAALAALQAAVQVEDDKVLDAPAP